MTKADIRALAVALADELHSRGVSLAGIGAPGQGDQCETEQNESMDRTSTETDGDVTSLERMARDDIARLRRGLPLSSTRKPLARKRAARP